MQLDKITTVIRPRGAWEALDLGFVMARSWWRPMILSWLVVTGPFYLLMCVLLREYAWLAITITWWLKPLWERTQLYILSHAVFGEVPTVAQTIWAFPKLAVRQIITSLTWRRFSFSRSMDLPVVQLENLSGQRRSQRLSVLHRSPDSAAAWLTIIGMHVESFIYLSFFLLIFWLIPEQEHVSLTEWIEQSSDATNVVSMVSWYFATSLVAPFYVAGGFALYLNRRIHLEAWDVEVVFRRILQKQTAGNAFSGVATTIGVLLLAALLSFKPADCLAQDQGNAAPVERNAEYLKLDQTAAAELIKATFEHDDFDRKKTIKLPKFLVDREPEDEPEESSEGVQAFIAMVAELLRLLFWVAAVLLIGYCVLKARAWIAQFITGEKPQRKSVAKPDMLFGLDVRPESLPDDVAEAARRLAAQGRIRDALALLYRAMLSMLLEKYKVPLRAGHTEGECVLLARNHVPNEMDDYFAELSRVWINVAYGHRNPAGNAVESLCQRWPQSHE